MRFLIDTNVLSESRRGTKANPGMIDWYSSVEPEQGLLSVMTIGEIRRGVRPIGRRDPDQARRLTGWLEAVRETYAGRILPVDADVATIWADITVPDRRPEPDGLIAATALAHDLPLVTRNTRDFTGLGLRLVNPFM